MKYLTFLYVIFLYACSGSTAQSVSHEMQQEQELDALLAKSNETQKVNYELQKKAEEKQTKIIDKTVTQIVELKTEINELKQELNSITNDTTIKFKLLPISDN